MILAGRSVLLTGASRGLGAALARGFWREGASLVLVARAPDPLQRLAAELAPPRAPDQTVLVFAADLTRDDAPGAIVAFARERGRRLDALVNNAGVQGPIGPAWENDWEAWQQALRVNLLAPVALCRACAPWLAERPGGKIVNLSGGGATGPRANFSAYATAKAALVRFSECLAHELRAAQVDVNCVAPGAMKTDMTKAVAAAGPAAGQEAEDARRRLEQEDTALPRAVDLVTFLISRRSDGITGRLLSAVWDPWEHLIERRDELQATDIYTLRRIVPEDRGKRWGANG